MAYPENSKSAPPSEVAKGVIITWLIVEVLRVKKVGIWTGPACPKAFAIP
jgi:hypothetical protein